MAGCRIWKVYFGPYSQRDAFLLLEKLRPQFSIVYNIIDHRNDVNTVQTTSYCKIKNTSSTNFTSTNEVIQNAIHCSESVPSLLHSLLS